MLDMTPEESDVYRIEKLVLHPTPAGIRVNLRDLLSILILNKALTLS